MSLRSIFLPTRFSPTRSILFNTLFNKSRHFCTDHCEIEEAPSDFKVLTYAERAKSLAQLRISGTLSTISVIKNFEDKEIDNSGKPPLWASIMPYVNYNSTFTFGVFANENHNANLLANDFASLVVRLIFFLFFSFFF